MSKNNDERIRELKELINKELVGTDKIPKDFNTNLILNFQGKTYNLQVIEIRELQELLIHLYLYQLAIEAIPVEGFSVSGFIVEDWISDINKLIKIKEQDNRVNKLRQELNKLDSLMSNEAKTSDYLDNLTDFIKCN